MKHSLHPDDVKASHYALAVNGAMQEGILELHRRNGACKQSCRAR